MTPSDDPYSSCIDRHLRATDSRPPPGPAFPELYGKVPCELGNPGDLLLGPVPVRDYEVCVCWGDRAVGVIDVHLRTAPLAEYTVVLDVTGE